MLSLSGLSNLNRASSSSTVSAITNNESLLHDCKFHLKKGATTQNPSEPLVKTTTQFSVNIVAQGLTRSGRHNASSQIPNRIPTYVVFNNVSESSDNNEQFKIASEMNSKKGPINEVDVDEVVVDEVVVDEVDVDEVVVDEVESYEAVSERGLSNSIIDADSDNSLNELSDGVGFETVQVQSVGEKVLACVKNLVLALFASIKRVLARVKTSEKIATNNKHSLTSLQANKVNSIEGSRPIGLADPALKILRQEEKKQNINHKQEPAQKIEMLEKSQEWLSFLYPNDFMPKSDGESSVDFKGIGVPGQTSLTEKEERLLKVQTKRAVKIISKKNR